HFTKVIQFVLSRSSMDFQTETLPNAAGVSTTSIYLPLVRTRMIEPTPMYATMPAMSAEHAARKICRAICNRQRTIRPWWLIFGQLGTVLFRGLWELLATRYLKRRPYA
ncbi:hypothetical protein, partial [Nemorincola caseinilytica]|uniref:hypothetical protein n=1 Tax=Nemorincola caseinilytica TaxID=2054315 RepID=UPI003CD0988F